MKDRSWEKYGKDDPYFAVLTDKKFKTKNINSQSLQEFFESGEEYIRELFSKIKVYFPIIDVTKFNRVLDFGCGTGRMLVSFAKQFEHVTGVDISLNMLSEADKNLRERHLKNVTLIEVADFNKKDFNLSFDFVHSYIVLQHIPIKTGYRIIDKLVASTRKNGLGMLHITYANPSDSIIRKQVNKLKANYTWIRYFINILKGKRYNEPFMQMNLYDLSKVFHGIFKKYNVKQTCIDYTDHGGVLGLCIYFQK